MIKKLILCAALMSVICIIGITGTVNGAIPTVASKAEQRQVIILDAGHGGFDGGAVAADGTVEKDINLNISLQLCEILKYCGFDVIMTRTNDTATDDVETKVISTRKKSDLKNRLELMADYPEAIFVSIHLNKFTTSAASGTQVFYSPNNEKSILLGKKIQSSVVSLIQPENNRVIKKGTDSTFLLRKAEIPAVIVECGFISNKMELEKLKDENYQQKIAFAVASGIIEFFSE